MSKQVVQDKYSGDVSPEETWEAIAQDPDAALVDVRTGAEWTYVGVPDLASIEKQLILVQWQTLPSMALNPSFVEEVRKADVTPDSKLYFLCRSGQRSKAAAIAATAQGFKHCFNVSGGFEGGLDAEGHRGRINGWKVAGLPWKQG